MLKVTHQENMPFEMVNGGDWSVVTVMFIRVRYFCLVISLHNVIGIMLSWKNFNSMLINQHFKNFFPKSLLFLRGDF